MDTRLDAQTLGWIGLALLTQSSSYASIAYTLPYFTPGEVAFSRIAIACLFFLALLRIRGKRLPPRHTWPQIALLGVLGLTVYHTCLNVAETRIASGTAAILIALGPAATAAFSAYWLRERLSPRSLLGLVVAMAGVVLVALTSGGGQLSFHPMTALVLVSVVVFAIYCTLQKQLFIAWGTEAVTTGIFIGGALSSLPLALHLPEHLLAAPWQDSAVLLWLGIGPTFLGYLGWNTAIHRASATRVNSFIYFSPPIAVLIGWLWLGEQPEPLTLIGGAITVGGVILANMRKRECSAPVAQEGTTITAKV